MEFLKLEAEGSPYRRQVMELYESAFPKEEKKPFAVMEMLAKEGKMELTAIVEEETWLGLAFFMICDRNVILDYFAISPALRSGGYGGRAVKKIMERFQDKKLIFEIEKLDEGAENAVDRRRRKRFYLRNGMKETGVFANVYQTDFELLTADGTLEYEAYVRTLCSVLGEEGLALLNLSRIEEV